MEPLPDGFCLQCISSCRKNTFHFRSLIFFFAKFICNKTFITWIIGSGSIQASSTCNLNQFDTLNLRFKKKSFIERDYKRKSIINRNGKKNVTAFMHTQKYFYKIYPFYFNILMIDSNILIRRDRCLPRLNGRAIKIFYFNDPRW